MNKLLAASLIAAVAMPVASADVCGNGGFYMGVNVGMAYQKVTVKKMKAQSDAVEEKEAANALKKAYDALANDAMLEKNGRMIDWKSVTAATALDPWKPEWYNSEGTFDFDWTTTTDLTTMTGLLLTSTTAPTPVLQIISYIQDIVDDMNDVNDLRKRFETNAALLEQNGYTHTPNAKAKKKGHFLAELNVGYDWRINDVMVGIDLNAGGIFGSSNVKYLKYDNKTDLTTTAGQVKEKWHVALMPRLGYLVTPETELYITAGAKLAQLSATTLKDETLSEVVSKKKVRFAPVVGAGVRYQFTPNVFAKLEYNYEFKTKAKIAKDSAHDTAPKIQSHVVKLGLGYRF